MTENALVERTYQSLMGVVQTTAVSRKVLARPPFTFLHKLLVETLGEYDLFSEQQLQFSAMVTKQAKAAFLTRAVAFVAFAMNTKPNRQHISCLLLVSPVQVLAGVSVPDTLEFLLQLCEVCRMPDRAIKEAAAKEVREKGDAHLYSSGVTFRKGLVLIQSVIRSFLKRRVRRAAPRLSNTPAHGRELSMTEGTHFLKELADGRVYNGIIRSVQKNMYVLGYEEDAEAQDKVNEIEMKIILKESQRLSGAHESLGRRECEDGEISLTDLPDLTDPSIPGMIKRVSSRDSGEALLVSKTSKLDMFKRSHTHKQLNMDMGLFSVPSSDSILLMFPACQSLVSQARSHWFLCVVDTAFAGTYQTTDQRTQEKQAMIRDIVMRIDSYMKRKRLRVIDLFRFCDADGNGSISPEEMIETLSQMEIQLTPDQAHAFLQHIDKDGNGSIDVDEFEELVRVSRRNEAQREQLKKELNGSRKQSENKPSHRHNGVMKAKTKQAILDEFKAAQEQDDTGMNANQLRSLIAHLSLPGINDAFVSSLVDRVVEIAEASASLSPPSSSQSQTRGSNKCVISYHHLTKALDELEWTKKSNRFLDPSWIRQFDSQLERAIREYELL
ncbi:uncharacterized protein PITG_10084 [Phytophthora infestans T30-4]|uniref:EF-hand domain-containing protein n=1 Tax=Phytophthora infestans (strain T30-4) TaxID=403677 RepID=D0NE96_PHYIT|nr:uncharacterized protein PITG_10084 [Phytophthora infestans T30-4]EEY56541.1 conserved hypothetical protein [Phytophthora infestans T30-4]|eukprot:XP_002902615.1 conserved hypothetical protein [Phytophthora infestans T30-4]